MKTAKRIDEFTPDEVKVIDGFTWLAVNLSATKAFREFKALPEVAEYDGKRFYKMSWNSDSYRAYYKEAKDRLYHERYMS